MTEKVEQFRYRTIVFGRPYTPSERKSHRIDCRATSFLGLPLDEVGSRLVVAYTPGRLVETPLSVVERQQRACSPDHQCLDLPSVFLICDDVKREVSQFLGVDFLSSLKSAEHVSSADVARPAHRIVGDVHALSVIVPLDNPLADIINEIVRDFLRDHCE
jgi:hypothetical protein